jgi:hypothetical protein
MRSTEQLVGELVATLEPVRLIPRLRTVAGMALTLGVVSSAMVLGRRGVRSDLAAGALSSCIVLMSVGLAIVALGGITASLGAGVPGRERVAQVGLRALLAGLVVAAGAGGWALVSAGAATWEGIGLECLATALIAGVLPGLALLGFLVAAFPARPALALAAASGGAVALGSVSVHLSCPATGGLHLLLGHVGAPVLGGLVLALVLYPVLCRLRSQAQPGR